MLPTAGNPPRDVLAVLRAHAARAGGAIGMTFVPGLAGLDSQDQRRFEAAQRTCALRWLAVLWKQRDTRTDEFTSQFDRARRLQSAAAGIRADRAASCP
jgi:hypothetical protein